MSKKLYLFGFTLHLRSRDPDKNLWSNGQNCIGTHWDSFVSHCKQNKIRKIVTIISSTHQKYDSTTTISAIAVSFLPSSSSTSSKSSLSLYLSKQDSLPGPTPYVFLRTPRPQLRETINRHACHPFLQASAIMYDFQDPLSTAKITHNNVCTRNT